MKDDETKEVNDIMGCDCDYDVHPYTTYLKNNRIITVLICSGCGKQVMLEGPIEDIYDLTLTRHKRKD